jgi:hypothetical protein
MDTQARVRPGQDGVRGLGREETQFDEVGEDGSAEGFPESLEVVEGERHERSVFPVGAIGHEHVHVRLPEATLTIPLVRNRPSTTPSIPCAGVSSRWCARRGAAMARSRSWTRRVVT